MMRLALLAAAAAAVSADKLVYPTFAGDFSALIVQDLELNQGGFAGPEGSVCCAEDAADCQVQVQSQGGQTYVSTTLQATAQYFPDGTGIVTVYNDTQVEAAVDSTNTCTSYCPTGGGSVTPYTVFGFTDQGDTADPINGIPAELWQDVDVIPIFNITMEIDNVYVNQTDYKNANPLLEIDILTPFGEYIGGTNTTYSNYVVGPQNPSKFVINGLSNCPLDQNCNSNARQLHRRALGQKARFWKGYFAAKAAKAAAELKAAQESQSILVEALAA